MSEAARRAPATANGNANGNGKGRAAATFAAQLTFENVTRDYDQTQALTGVNLDVAPAEVVCLLGPSGCGKTTLLRVAAGIEKPTSGRVLINGLEVAGPSRFVAPENRGVGLMFQDFALFPHLTILGNVAFGLKSLPKPEARREALAALKRVGLAQSRRRLSAHSLRRPAAARGACPRHRAAPGGHAHGRAVLRPRCAAA